VDGGEVDKFSDDGSAEGVGFDSPSEVLSVMACFQQLYLVCLNEQSAMNEPVPPGRPLVWATLRPIHSDCDNLRRALAKLAEDDPGFSVDDEDADGQIIIRALGELHLEIICERLVRERSVYVESGGPNIIYLETIRETSAAEGEFNSQSGARSQYAHVVIRIEPNPRRGYEFADETPGGAIPNKYVDSVDKGVRYALRAGVVAGYEVVDIKVTLCDGGYHEGDSDDEAFESAGFMAAKTAMRRASPVLLEPLMSLEVIVPQELTGSVMGDLNLRRGRIEGMEDRAGEQAIQAIVPLAEIISYATDLRSITRGRATYSAQFAHYELASGLPPAGDDSVGVTANKPWKPKPKRGAEAVEPPWLDSNC
jgi:elongation factor G